MTETLWLQPGRPTRLPGTGIEIRWDGDHEIPVHRTPCGIWNLSGLLSPDRILAWERLAEHPHLGWWPLAWPPAAGTVYRSRARGDPAQHAFAAEDG